MPILLEVVGVFVLIIDPRVSLPENFRYVVYMPGWRERPGELVGMNASVEGSLRARISVRYTA